ncbi:MAG: hypothetical protein JRJ87_14545 [Deltaproteobacteria bacterium]|nr:hypothetical protein [Deltaproteobacteria bacterium]
MKRLVTALLLSSMLAACGSNESQPVPGPCADTSTKYALPSPAWHQGTHLSAPPGDAAAALLGQHRAEWLTKLDQLDGWPIRPTIVVPMSKRATSIDPSLIKLYADTGSGLLEWPVEFSASLEDSGRSLILKPTNPFPPEVRDVILVVREGAAGSAIALPACGADQKPDQAYVSAKESIADLDDVQLALPFRLATTHQDLEYLWERLDGLITPALIVESIEERTLESFGEKAPPPEIAVHLAPTAYSGILELPEYRDANGVFVRDLDKGPKIQGSTRPGFVLALPAQGAPPYPLVIFQHGGGQNKADFLLHAKPLAEAGFAIIGLDLPFHGDRASASGGSDLDILDFDNLLRTRDNLRQAAADQMAIISGVDSLNAALEPFLGTSSSLDPEKVFYMGLSMGGISGSLTFATARKLNAAALFVGAAGYSEIVQFGFFSLMVADILELDPLEREVVLGLAEVLLDGADPYAYAKRSEDRSTTPRPVIFFQAEGELIIDPPTNDAWARAFGADLAKPFDHSVSGMQELDLPADNNFSWTGSGNAATRLLIQCPLAEVSAGERHGGLIVQDYSQQIVADCFRSFLDQGKCTVLDTDFASH